MEEASAASDLAPEHTHHALEIAYRYIGKRERTTAEVTRRLKREGFGLEVIDQTLAALSEAGTLDDARFARLFLQDKRELEQWGSDRIRRTLVQRGLDPETVEAALDGGAGGGLGAWEDERERALSLLRRRFPQPPRTRRERERALGMLLRKGYDSELALDALTAYARE